MIFIFAILIPVIWTCFYNTALWIDFGKSCIVPRCYSIVTFNYEVVGNIVSNPCTSVLIAEKREFNTMENPKIFFYVDESGNTGTNLFDEKQPYLHYGLISSKVDLDQAGKDIFQRAKNYLCVERLHANELGFKGLQRIINYLYEFDDRFKPGFGIYSVKKIDFVAICFFDQVFDQGLNPAVTWTGYWTPLRYPLLFNLVQIFDIDILQEAWAARIELNKYKAASILSKICNTLLSRLDYIPDERARTLIKDTLHWASDNPHKLNYNCQNKNDVLSVAPNIIAFQSVMHAIAHQIGSPDVPAKITVDKQSQFNKAQQTLADYYKIGRENNPLWKIGYGLPVMNLSNIPKTPIEFVSSNESTGLEIVDIYLWLGKKVIEDKKIKGSLGKWFARRALSFDEGQISIEALQRRWAPFFKKLKDSSTPEKDELGRKLIKIEEERRTKAMNDNNI